MGIFTKCFYSPDIVDSIVAAAIIRTCTGCLDFFPVAKMGDASLYRNERVVVVTNMATELLKALEGDVASLHVIGNDNNVKAFASSQTHSTVEHNPLMSTCMLTWYSFNVRKAPEIVAYVDRNKYRIQWLPVTDDVTIGALLYFADMSKAHNYLFKSLDFFSASGAIINRRRVSMALRPYDSPSTVKLPDGRVLRIENHHPDHERNEQALDGIDLVMFCYNRPHNGAFLITAV